MDNAERSQTFASRTVAVRDSWLYYREMGAGKPIVFLHGNPTSSYLWRNVLPYAAPYGRCLAVDLIGMGGSGKPPIAYRLRDHIAYLDAFIAALGLDDITFVMHDWGVALGLDYLTRHPERVRAVAFMEGHPHPIARWGDYDPGARALFTALRSVPEGRRLIVDENVFIETVLPSGMAHTLTAEEWAAYRAPYLEPSSREPLWRWPQEIPIAGTPADVEAIVRDYRAALVTVNGNAYVGVCIDTGSGTGFCAEHSAIAAMVTAGEYRIASIVAVWRDARDGTLFVLPPCGRCREFIRQIDVINLDTDVVLGMDRARKLRELLPPHEWPEPRGG